MYSIIQNLFQQFQQIHYKKMRKSNSPQEEQYLPSNLLEDDDDLPTSTSLKQDFDDNRSFAFSAPPILFDIGYKLDYQEDDFSDFDMPQSNYYHPAKTYSKKACETYEDLYSPPVNSIRKLSLQNEQYMGYTVVNIPTNQYYRTLTPQQELLNNLQQVCRWSKDQNGSRAVQNVFQTGQEYTKQLIFTYIFKQHEELMKDRFGNYVFQKIFQKGLEKHKKKLIQVIKSNILDLSEHCYGCRVVQKAIQYAKQNAQVQGQLIKNIQPVALRLIQNQNGNHVLQKCCQIMAPKLIQNMADQLIKNLPRLAFHAYGCRVIQKYLQNCKGEQKQGIIFQQLLNMSFDLSQCQYGNYVMQHIVMNCKGNKQKLLTIFYDNFIVLSSNKYASNVIQKMIKSAPVQYKQKLAQLLIDSPELVMLAKHQFGNYVIQSLMQKISKQKKLVLKAKLKENCQQISKSQYGRHVLMQLDKYK